MSTVEDAEHARAGNERAGNERAGNERAPMFERLQPFEKSHFEAMDRFDDDDTEPRAQTVQRAHAQTHVHDAPESERRSIFNTLVTGDGDVVGLVAYSIYKQNKHDFLVAFGREFGREPDESELAAYTLGEATPRRLATYRHLAEGTLAGRGPEAQPAAAPRATAAPAPAFARASSQSSESVISTATIISLVTILVVIGLCVWLALRFGVIG